MKRIVRKQKPETAPRVAFRGLRLPGAALGAIVLAVGVLAAVPERAEARSRVGVGLGLSVNDRSVGTGTWIGYTRSSGRRSNVTWGVGLGYASPGYAYSYGRPPVRAYRHPPPAQWSVSYGQRRGHTDWRMTYRTHPYAYNYYHYGYAYSPYAAYRVHPPAAGHVTGMYRGERVAIGARVPLDAPRVSTKPPRRQARPSSSRAITSGRPVEYNPIMKRVWVEGYYERFEDGLASERSDARAEGDETRRAVAPSSAPMPQADAGATATSPSRVASGGTPSVEERERMERAGYRWVPGHWVYVPDTY